MADLGTGSDPYNLSQGDLIDVYNVFSQPVAYGEVFIPNEQEAEEQLPSLGQLYPR